MVEKLEKMLEYQKVDIELRRALDEIERNDLNRKKEQARQEFAGAKNSVLETEKAAENIIAFYNSAEKYFEDASKKFEELENKLSETDENDEASRREILSQMETLRDKMSELEKKLSEKKSKSDGVIKAYLDAQEKGKKMRDIYNNVKQKLDAFKEEKMPRINELEKTLASLESGIDKSVFETYKSITAERKYPAVVSARTSDGGKSFTCSGCGLAISQKVKDELLEKSVCRCDNCRRIIYKDK